MAFALIASKIMSKELLEPGELIGQKYQVIRAIGSGAVSTVYLVRDAFTESLFAMKILSTDASLDFEAKSRFEREAEILYSLKHESLVALCDSGFSDSGSPYYVMELIIGCSLREVLAKHNHLESSRASRIFIQVCDAMDYAHSSGLIHRDLKPGNIMILDDGEKRDKVKVVDFGLAIQISDYSEEKLRITREGMVVGSPAYMSPEQCMGAQLDRRSDVFSFGCVMYETLCGKRTFEGADLMSLFVKQATETPQKVTLRNPKVKIDPNWEEIIEKALAKDPQLRYQSMLELRSALLKISAFS
jgi:serine/threonine-protein kinase